MEVYASRTHGSYIEDTQMNVLWLYHDTDPEFGYLQARESKTIHPTGVEGGDMLRGLVEVRPRGINKGVVATHILKNI
jgi:trehalose 6-phosphate synthase/phosphatase